MSCLIFGGCSDSSKNQESVSNDQQSNAASPSPVPGTVVPGGMPPTSKPITYVLVDGTKITALLKGGPCLNWEEDENGYTIIASEEKYFYAKLGDDGSLVPTEYEVTKHDPKQIEELTPHTKPKPKEDCPFNG